MAGWVLGGGRCLAAYGCMQPWLARAAESRERCMHRSASAPSKAAAKLSKQGRAITAGWINTRVDWILMIMRAVAMSWLLSPLPVPVSFGISLPHFIIKYYFKPLKLSIKVLTKKTTNQKIQTTHYSYFLYYLFFAMIRDTRSDISYYPTSIIILYYY